MENETIKVRWKMDVIDHLRQQWNNGVEWAKPRDTKTTIYNYSKEFDVPYFTVDRSFSIKYPENLCREWYGVDSRDVQPYFEFSIPDEIFD